ncbi:MAG TPA: DUF1629 domain-containing protein [Cellvibrio sp.]|nr:DUF1629 domain-containing protein [Cellvibrio sp.]
MYFQLTRDKFFEVGIVEPEDLPLELSFISGSVITQVADAPWTFMTNASAREFLPDFSGGSIPVMSQRLLSLLEQAGVDNLQKFPILVKSEVNGTIWDGYFAVNVVGVVQCADLPKSEYDEIGPDLYDFDVLAIDANRTKGALLFRLQESPSRLIMHKSVGKYIMENDLRNTLTGWDVEEIIQ